MFGREHLLLMQEGNLAKSALMAGLESVAKMDYDRPGGHYLAFFHLSIGFERLMKIVFIIDHKAKHALKNPTDAALRKFGHDLLSAYSHSKKIAVENGMPSDEWYEDGTVEHNVVTFLSEFAQGSRYHNLDKLVGGKQNNEPLLRWHEIHKAIAEQYVSGTRLRTINEKAIAHCDRHGLYGFERALDGEFFTQVDMTYLHELLRVSRGYCVWTLIRILKPFYDLLFSLTRRAQALEPQGPTASYVVPYMYEFFPFCLCDRRTATRRQKWVGIY